MGKAPNIRVAGHERMDALRPGFSQANIERRDNYLHTLWSFE